MPTPNPRPRPPGSLDNTLGQFASSENQPLNQGQIATDPAFLALAQSLQAPQAQQTPNQPGIGSLILGSLGGALQGDPNAAPNMILQQQQHIAQVEAQNQQLEQQFQEQQLNLLLAGARESRRVSERQEDQAGAAAQQLRENALEEEQLRIQDFRARTDRMRIEGALDDETAQRLGSGLSSLVIEADALGSQLSENVRTARESLSQGASLPDFALATPDGTEFSSPTALKEVFDAQKQSLLGGIEDPAQRKDLEADFDRIFETFIGKHLTELDRIIGLSSRRTQSQESAARSKAEEKNIRKFPTAALPRSGQRTRQAARSAAGNVARRRQ